MLNEFEYSPLQRELYQYISTHGPLNRTQLTALTNAPRTTVYDNLMRLVDENLIIKISGSRDTRGRPKVFYLTPSQLQQIRSTQNDKTNTE